MGLGGRVGEGEVVRGGRGRACVHRVKLAVLPAAFDSRCLAGR